MGPPQLEKRKDRLLGNQNATTRSSSNMRNFFMFDIQDFLKVDPINDATMISCQDSFIIPSPALTSCLDRGKLFRLHWHKVKTLFCCFEFDEQCHPVLFSFVPRRDKVYSRWDVSIFHGPRRSWPFMIEL